MLEALINHSSEELSEYLKSRPHKQFTMLDCHDGIPVKPDMDGLIDTNEAKNLVNHCVERGANLSLIVSDEHKGEDGFDVHQIRCTFYDALDRNDDASLQQGRFSSLRQAYRRSIMSVCSRERMTTNWQTSLERAGTSIVIIIRSMRLR